MGALRKVQPCDGQYPSSIFLVQKPDKSFRLILNLKNLNKFVHTSHFKLEDHKTVIGLLKKDDFMATVGLKDAYTFIPIHKQHRKYLRFCFQGQIYELNSLPFGLNCAPFLFTKLMKPVISCLRNQGFRLVIYLDDLLILGASDQEFTKNVVESIALLESLGFAINYDKSVTTPTQIIKYLGFLYNSAEMIIILPMDQKEKIFALTKKFSLTKRCQIRVFARFVGTLTSACPAISYGWLYTKSFERQKYLALRDAQGNYDSLMNIPFTLSTDFDWWLTNIITAQKSLKPRNFDMEIFSDSSLTGWGLFCNGERSHGFWSASERLSHVNNLELLAAFFGLKCFASNLTHKEYFMSY